MNGTLFKSAASTNKCPHVLIERARGVRVAAVNARSVPAPAASRVVATSTGDIARRPSLIHQKEQPQIAPSSTNHTCHPIRRGCGALVTNPRGLDRCSGVRAAYPCSRFPSRDDPTARRGAAGGHASRCAQRRPSRRRNRPRARPGTTRQVRALMCPCACYRVGRCAARPILAFERR